MHRQNLPWPYGRDGTLVCHPPATLQTRVRLRVTTTQIDCDRDFDFYGPVGWQKMRRQYHRWQIKYSC